MCISKFLFRQGAWKCSQVVVLKCVFTVAAWIGGYAWRDTRISSYLHAVSGKNFNPPGILPRISSYAIYLPAQFETYPVICLTYLVWL